MWLWHASGGGRLLSLGVDECCVEARSEGELDRLSRSCRVSEVKEHLVGCGRIVGEVQEWATVIKAWVYRRKDQQGKHAGPRYFY